VLVVDDDEGILFTIAQALELDGYQVETAMNGAQALSTVERSQPDLVLLDMRMPVMDGWAFTDAVRARGLDVKIVVMTATPDVRRWADEVHADGFLGKPFDLDSLLDLVQRLCG
jgi:urea transport system substrate-binding protein